jgi:putative transposase
MRRKNPFVQSPCILPLLLKLQPVLPKTTCRQLAHIVAAMLTMTGRITQRGISRWNDQGGSYRTLQRFFQTNIDGLAVNGSFCLHFVWDRHGTYLLAGDETVVSKSGKRSFGLDRFFSSLAERAIPALACFSMALIHGGKRQAYSLSNEQVVRTEQEKQPARDRKQKRKECAKKKAPAKPKGRPKGSKNKSQTQVPLSAELLRLQAQAKKVCEWIRQRFAVNSFVLDGHFGNSLACQMVRSLDLHLISKLRSDAALYLDPTTLQKQLHPRLKYGNRLDFAALPADLLRSSHTEAGYVTQVYQVRCLHKSFDRRLNVVLIKKTHLASGRVGHVILFSSDLFLGAETLTDYYTLRFQIEFTFRDAKQHFGLEDFMGVTKTCVSNAMGLSLFLVNLSTYLLGDLGREGVDAGIADLRSWYRGRFYASAVLKLLPEPPEAFLCERLVEQICRLGCIHSAFQGIAELKIVA